jgi:hypothetical protein
LNNEFLQFFLFDKVQLAHQNMFYSVYVEVLVKYPADI